MTTAPLTKQHDLNEPHDAPSPDGQKVQPISAARVSFRQPVTDTGFIDAGWWPRSHDLVAELPDLLALLSSSGREITRVTYSLSAWKRAPAQLVFEHRQIHLGGFNSSDPLTVRLSDAWGRERIDVLVIPPETEAAVAERAMLLASVTDGRRRAGEIMTQAGVGSE